MKKEPSLVDQLKEYLVKTGEAPEETEEEIIKNEITKEKSPKKRKILKKKLKSLEAADKPSQIMGTY
tara:strand:+ start:496 stop:696 length:201 start_codon:yes stop_codon:yes gene_type:complete